MFCPPHLVSRLDVEIPFVGASNISALRGGGSFILSSLAGESRCIGLQHLLVERIFLDIVLVALGISILSITYSALMG